MIGELTNHLWQSTVFAVAAAMLTLAFRKNRAQVRYWVWLSASVKFFVPFSLLMSFGSRLWAVLAPGKLVTVFVAPVVSQTMAQISDPFSEAFAPQPSAAAQTTNWVFLAIVGVWACGFLGVLLMRYRGWLRIRAAMRASRPIDIEATVPVRSTPELLEPGVVGFLRPILLLPEGILIRLTPEQMVAVLAHEQCHVRRRDNLTSAMHMIAEAVFWFHPMVWWIGAKLVEERERACDEAVLSFGSKPRDYAEGILNVCKIYKESPLHCISGVTGSDLKRRIRAILTGRVDNDLTLAKKVTLAIAGIAAIATPMFVGAISAPSVRSQSTGTARPQFEVAAIKPSPDIAAFKGAGLRPDIGIKVDGSQVTVHSFSLTQLICTAYRIKTYQVSGPDWMKSTRFDIIAKMPEGANRDQVPDMIRSLLEDRFMLAVHRDMRDQPVYAMVVGKNGAKLMPSSRDKQDGPDSNQSAGKNESNGSYELVKKNMENGMVHYEYSKMTMETLVQILAPFLDRPLVNKTDLSDSYDVVLDLSMEDMMAGTKFAMPAPPPPIGSHLEDAGSATGAPELTGRSIFASVERLGLGLERKKLPFEFIVVDHLEKVPTAN